jgi:hypothetical protein
MTPSQRMASCERITGEVDPWEFSARIGSSKEIGDYLDHFGEFLNFCGVRHFSPLEVSTPSKSSQNVASRTGATRSMYRGQFVLDLSKSGDLKAAHDAADEIYHRHAEDLEISLGLGDTVVHFGIHSPNGHRRWSY